MARLLALILILVPTANASTDARELFGQFKNSLFQIRTIDLASNSKASIGSAFAISSDGLLATNYHVISKTIFEPKKYRLDAIDHNNESHAIEVLKVDAINDLAIVRLSKKIDDLTALSLTEQSPEQGQEIYSLGNPHDLGMTVVPGTYNGFTAHAFYERILFSGSINPGMSGGPVLNREGKVVGVNVATSGNALSFLVPHQKLALLLQAESKDDNFLEQISEQLSANQDALYGELLNESWKTSKLGDTTIFDEFADFVRCWGDSDDTRDKTYRQVIRRCMNDEQIFISSELTTGHIEIEYYWYQSKKLKQWPFYALLNATFDQAGIRGRATEEMLTEFSCQEDFVKDAYLKLEKSVFCVRAYKKFKHLYDVLYLSVGLEHSDKTLVSHFTMTGVSQDKAQRFLTRFMKAEP